MNDYNLIAKQVGSFAEDEPHWLPVMANTASLLFHSMSDLNWAGFYIVEGGSLLLGPFNGNPACIRIQPGKGVCGTTLAEDEVQRVENVHDFPGHIACDSASNSEIVIPIHSDGKVVAVLDIDSPDLGRFSFDDEEGLLRVVRVIEELTDFSTM